MAAICVGSTTLILWDSNTFKKQNVEVGLRDKLSCLIWAKSGPLLAIATHSGNVSIYNHSSAKLVYQYKYLFLLSNYDFVFITIILQLKQVVF